MELPLPNPHQSGTDVEQKGPACNLHSSSSQMCWMGSVQVSKFLPHQTPTMTVKDLLCSLEHGHAGIEKSLPKTVHNVGSIAMSWYAEVRGRIQTIKDIPTPFSLLHQTQLAQYSKVGNVLQASVKPRLITHDSSLHRKCFYCSTVQWWCAFHHSITHLAFDLVM